MNLSKKYLCTVALALLGAVAFPSCKGDGEKDQPTPPSEERALISTLTVKGTSEHESEYFCTYQYSYDEAGRVSSVAVRGDFNRDHSFTYGNGMMTIAINSENTIDSYEFLTDANGYIVKGITGGDNLSASRDAEGHLLQLLLEGYDDTYTLKWKGDLLSEALCIRSDYYDESITTTFVYSKTMNPAGLGLGIIYGLLGGELSDIKSFPLRMWLGKQPPYLPSKVINHIAHDRKQYSEEDITTFDATTDAKGRPVKIIVTETSYEYDQYKDKKPLPDRKVVSTIEITYK